MAEQTRMVPEWAKYSITVMPLRDTNHFPDRPNPGWHKREILIPAKDITRLFTEFQEEIGEVEGPVSFAPRDTDGIRVYFNPNDNKSLYIVVESESMGDDYAQANNFPKPYNVPKPYRHYRRSWD